MFTHIIPLEAHRFSDFATVHCANFDLRSRKSSSTSSRRPRLSVLFCIVRGFCTATEKIISDTVCLVVWPKHTLFHVMSPKLDRMEVVNIGRDSTPERVSANRSFRPQSWLCGVAPTSPVSLLSTTTGSPNEDSDFLRQELQ